MSMNAVSLKAWDLLLYKIKTVRTNQQHCRVNWLILKYYSLDLILEPLGTTLVIFS